MLCCMFQIVGQDRLPPHRLRQIAHFLGLVQIVPDSSHIHEMIDKIRPNQDFVLIDKKKDTQREGRLLLSLV